MAKIKVTGYIDIEDMRADDLDLDHVMGVSDEFYNGITSMARQLPPLEDIEFELEA